MRVIIAGAGEVGGHAADVLSNAGHIVTLIDIDAEKLRAVGDRLDIRTLHGSCTHFSVLREAGAERTDLMIAATRIDEINLLSASVSKAAGVKKTIVRVHHTANFALKDTTYARQIGIDELICPEHLTSLAIAQTVRNPGSIAIEEFAGGQLLMQRFPVSKGAIAATRRLADLALPPGTRVATVDSDEAASLASASTVLQEGDFVTLVGEPGAFEAAVKLFARGKEKRSNIVVMGETSTAVWLCRALKSRVFSVRLFVDRRERATQLCEKLSHVTVIEADPTDADTIAEEHLERVDSFIAVTDDDERNVLACAQAKRVGAEQTIAIVQRGKYLHLLRHVGIDYAFSPRTDAVKAVLRLIDTGPIRSLATFAQDIAEVYQITPDPEAKVIGRDLRNIRMPADSMIAAIRRGDQVFVPGADAQVRAGDMVLVIGPRGAADELTDLFVNA